MIQQVVMEVATAVIKARSGLEVANESASLNEGFILRLAISGKLSAMALF
jgi:hypothetical protein